MEITNLFDKEFNVVIIKMLTELRKKKWINTVSQWGLQKTNKHPPPKEKNPGTLIKYQIEVKELRDTITELKNALQGSNNRLDETAEQIKELEDKALELIRQSSKNETKNFEKVKIT